MKRWIVTVSVVVVLLGMMLVPAFVDTGGSAEADSAMINDYQANFVVSGDGSLTATERLVVHFPTGKHGIFRFFDRNDPTDARVRLDPTDVSVTRNGQPEQFERLRPGRGRYLNLKIGRADIELYDTQVYEIRYRIAGVLAAGTDGARTQWYWNVIPGGWGMRIRQATINVQLPGRADPVRCAVGVGNTSGCQLTGEGTDRLTISTGPLEPRTPVTVKAGMDVPTPSRGDQHPWSLTWDRVFGTTVLGLGIILLLALAAAGAGLWLAGPTRERDPQFPLMYGPPEGIGPAQGRYLLTEKLGQEAFVASILQGAERGVTQLQKYDGGWKIEGPRDVRVWSAVDPVTAGAHWTLGAHGGRFLADGSVNAGMSLRAGIAAVERDAKVWARQSGLITTAGLGTGAGVLVVLSLLLAGFLAVVNPFNMAVVALVPGLFGACGVPALFQGASTRRTPAGRELWSRLGGFHRVLSTESAEARFDFSGRKELYTAYIPWAVAFGCAAQWARKYRLEMNEEPPEPRYAVGWMGYHAGAGGLGDAIAKDFSSSVNSSIKAYQATQSSSSGGGGGFSGGGGGGGGGGGSW